MTDRKDNKHQQTSHQSPAFTSFTCSLCDSWLRQATARPKRLGWGGISLEWLKIDTWQNPSKSKTSPAIRLVVIIWQMMDSCWFGNDFDVQRLQHVLHDSWPQRQRYFTPYQWALQYFHVFSVVIPDIPLPSSEHGSYGFYHSIAWIAFALSWSVSPRKRLSLNFHFPSHRSLDAAMMQTYTVTLIIVNWSIHNAEMGLGLPSTTLYLERLWECGSAKRQLPMSRCQLAGEMISRLIWY